MIRYVAIGFTLIWLLLDIISSGQVDVQIARLFFPFSMFIGCGILIVMGIYTKNIFYTVATVAIISEFFFFETSIQVSEKYDLQISSIIAIIVFTIFLTKKL